MSFWKLIEIKKVCHGILKIDSSAFFLWFTWKKVEINEKLADLSQENTQIKQMLNEVLEGILELLTRPWGLNLSAQLC